MKPNYLTALDLCKALLAMDLAKAYKQNPDEFFMLGSRLADAGCAYEMEKMALTKTH